MSLAIFLVYLVMASQFESFLHPFVIIFTLPLFLQFVLGFDALQTGWVFMGSNRKKGPGRKGCSTALRPRRRAVPTAAGVCSL